MSGISKIGKMALGSRLRALSDTLTENAKSLYELYDVPLKPKWFPVFYTLSKVEAMSISHIANEIGHSHPSVVKIVKELKEAGIASSQRGEKDARKNNVSLTPKGKGIAEKIEVQYEDVNAATEELLNHNNHDLWKALDEVEDAIAQKSLYRRVVEKKKIREVKTIRIVQYTPTYRQAFKELNQQWIQQYFKMEEADYQALDHPETHIIEKGGEILVALCENEPAGVCALIKLTDHTHDYELAKMAVSGRFRGKGIGQLLGQAVIDRAKKKQAKNLYLESNTVLKPAISLYRKLGFTKIQGPPSPFERSNIQMELTLT